MKQVINPDREQLHRAILLDMLQKKQTEEIPSFETTGIEQRYNYEQNGGEIQAMGYKDNSPYNNLPYIDINSNLLTMEGVSKPIKAIADTGEERILPANSGLHHF